ncbi:MAG: rod shape-determining protein MreC [Clostridia bacterium]|nr:rod shape-determining protein MreC [Clostridia bacterium]
MSKKSKIFLFVLIILSVLMAVFVAISANADSQLHGFYKVIGTPVYYVQKAFSSVGNAIGQRITILQDYKKIQAEIDSLREENEHLSSLEDENARLERENEELRALLEMEETIRDYKILRANVITQDVTGWFNEFTIDVGTARGVQNGYVVITSRGLVGIVYNAGLVSSKVRCIIDEQNVLMARISHNDELVRVRGTSNENYEGLLRVDRIAPDAEIQEGDTLVTAESGDVYPRGLTIGTVVRVGVDVDGTRFAEVEPSVHFSTLISVNVLLPQGESVPQE